MKASPPTKVKRRVGRPRKLPSHLIYAVLQTPKRTFEIYNFVVQYRIAHPRSSESLAIAAAEDEFNCSRSTIQRHIARLVEWAPIMDECAKTIRKSLMNPLAGPKRQWDLTPYEGLTERLAVFYSRNELAELVRLGAPIALKIAREREELEALRAAAKTRS